MRVSRISQHPVVRFEQTFFLNCSSHCALHFKKKFIKIESLVAEIFAKYVFLSFSKLYQFWPKVPYDLYMRCLGSCNKAVRLIKKRSSFYFNQIYILLTIF